MLQKMRRIQVIGPKRSFHEVVDTLYRTGTVHLEDVSQCISPEEISLKKVELEGLGDVPGILVKINGIFFTLPRTADEQGLQARFEQELSASPHTRVIERARQVIADLEWTTKSLALRKSDHEMAITALNRYEKVIRRIQHIEPELPALTGYEVNILIIQKEFMDVLQFIQAELAEITGNRFEFMYTGVDEESLAAIAVFNKRYSEQVHAFVFATNVNEVRLPEDFYGHSFQEMLEMIEERRTAASKEIAEINRELEELSHRWYWELSVLRRYIEDINEEMNTFGKFGESKYAFVIQGWVPQKAFRETARTLKETFGGRVAIETLPVTPEDLANAPTFYDNPRFVRPFEFFMKLMRPPRYFEVDPSPFMALFFPIFFGVMVGDVGYGLIIMAISAAVRARAKAQWLRDLASILLLSSVPTIVFGFLFGEFFGDLGEHMHLFHPVTVFGVTWNRMEAVIPMLALALVIGLFHVFLGLGVGLYNAWTVRSKKHMIEKIATAGVIVGLIVCLGCAARFMPDYAMWAGIALLLVSVPLVFYGGGVFGAIELISAVGNIMSYARLMAIGMASVVLAIVANEFAGALGIAAVGIVAAVLLHMMNLGMGMFSPSIHALRLHMVEFFSKFYQGGGQLYRPFKKLEKES
ncbi:MAG: V-type ATP synthase subunit I [Methanocella sp. PtaU1.Bin125]|nr:MAG: V-type ATP synthase subunit I [Methanocella sp. PtaU1.Bin125]